MKLGFGCSSHEILKVLRLRTRTHARTDQNSNQNLHLKGLELQRAVHVASQRSSMQGARVVPSSTVLLLVCTYIEELGLQS